MDMKIAGVSAKPALVHALVPDIIGSAMAEDNKPVVLTFGGGINARQRPADINIEECTEGENFNLDFQSSVLAPRRGLALRATAPNGEPIRGIAQLVKQDGTLSTIIQAGGTVYSWDGTATGFTEVGTVSPDARLRGPIDSNFTLDNFIIITDLSKIENVKKWTGEVFTDLEHNLGVDFKAKYVTVQTERAIFANVKTGTADTPHVILASKQGDSEVLTSTTRPAAAASAEDEWFLPTPDLRPINGIVFFAKTLLLSTERGRLYAIEGLIAGADNDGLPFTSIEDFHAGSAVSGEEAMVNIGNDVALGLPGRVETLRGIIEFGDVETNDASWWISPLIDGTFGNTVSTWKLVYDQAGQRVFCFPNNEDTAWVLHKSLLFGPNRATFGKIGKNISPWSKWTTSAVDGFRVTAVGVIFDPTDSPALLSTSPGASFTSFSGGTAPTLFFGFGGGGGTGGSLVSIKGTPPEDIVCDVDLIPIMTSDTTPSGVASASSTVTVFIASRAFDDDSSTGWRSELEVPSFSTQWLKYEFADPKVARAYTLGFLHNPSPKSWTFQGSNDDSSWTVLDTQNNFPNPGTLTVKFSFANETAYRYYRWLITESDDLTSLFQVRINEAEILSC